MVKKYWLYQYKVSSESRVRITHVLIESSISCNRIFIILGDDIISSYPKDEGNKNRNVRKGEAEEMLIMIIFDL